PVRGWPPGSRRLQLGTVMRATAQPAAAVVVAHLAVVAGRAVNAHAHQLVPLRRLGPPAPAPRLRARANLSHGILVTARRHRPRSGAHDQVAEPGPEPAPYPRGQFGGRHGDHAGSVHAAAGGGPEPVLHGQPRFGCAVGVTVHPPGAIAITAVM